MTYLLDVNVLIALAWPVHVHHRAAHAWWAGIGKGRARWATCAVTQLGFVRVSSNPSFSPDAVSPADALALLEASTASATHVYLNEMPEMGACPPALRARLTGHQQWTDVHLLLTCARHKARLATFDAGIAHLVDSTTLSSLVTTIQAE